MTESRNPNGEVEWRQTIERRLAAMERTAQLTTSSIKDGALLILDEDNVVRARLGLIDPATDFYGISMFDEDGGLRFEVNDDGFRDPWLANPWRDPNVFKPVTSGSFVTVFNCEVEIISHKGVSGRFGWATDGGTTGELKLVLNGIGQTATVVLPAGTTGQQQFQWLHGATLGTGPALFQIQARRTGGAGNVNVYWPDSPLYMADPLQCTANGL